MQLVYVDDSRDEGACVFSALAVPAWRWRSALDMLRNYRRELRRSDGIYVYEELHAWKFVSGRGRPSDRIVPKGRRCQIFKDTLTLATTLPDAQLFNVVGSPNDDEQAFEWLLNRINRTMKEWETGAVVICDHGKEVAYSRLRRRMGIHNPIPSRFGFWSETSRSTKNIPLDRIVEDLIFKDSQQSYFIQLADFCAYSLLRRERPVASKSKYGLDQAFELLSPIVVRACNPNDPHGVIRPKSR
jgi:hypothetical protein